MVTKQDNKFIFGNANMNIVMPEIWETHAGKYLSRPILFGGLLEDIGSKGTELDKDAPVIREKVEVIEPMGAETYLYLDAPTDSNASCIASVDAHKHVKVGNTLELSLALSKAHLFDPGTTNVLI